jgi:predicted AAA+ superfamily ATPase
MSLNHSESVIYVGDPDNNFQNKALINADISYALKGEVPHLIDEWQEIPQIWDAVRFEADRTPANGRFILTGSSTPEFKGVSHSGAGRIGTLRMRTMSLFESGDSDGSVSLKGLFDSTMENGDPVKQSLEHLIALTIRGGWPKTVDQSPESVSLIMKDYLDTCRKDASRLDGKMRDSEKMRMLIRSLARNESTVSSDQTVKRDMKAYDGESISDVTLADYLDALRRIFIIEDQPAFSPNLRSSVRVGKTPKRHLTDPALAAAAMGLTKEKLLNDLKTFGFLFEAMCERDLQIYAEANGGRLFHYRDGRGGEIDAVVELPDGRWGAFEIKVGSERIDEGAENLLSMADLFASDESAPPAVLCVICGMAPCAYRRADGVYVVPITSLRD